jgi:hypothetical protein
MLSKENQKALLGVTDRQCRDCLQWIRKNYCRSCDEFFLECDCTRQNGKRPHKHHGHRTY